MMVRKIIWLVILLEILGIASAVNAQGTSAGSGGKTFGERLDDFGQTLFGGFFSSNKDNAQNNKQAPRPIPGKYSSHQVSGDNSDTQSGTIIKPLTPDQQSSSGDSSARAIRVYRTDSSASAPAQQTVDNRPGRRYFENQKVQKAPTLRKTLRPNLFHLQGNRRLLHQIRIPREPWNFPIKTASLPGPCTKDFRNFAIRHLTILQKELRPTAPQKKCRYRRLRALR